MPQPSFEPSPLAPRRSPEEQARDRDLGFGSVVSRESRQRLLNRDGSFNVTRSGLGFLETFAPYHLLLTISWTGFLGVVGATYLLLNVVFAVAYLACGPDALLGAGAAMLGGRFSQAFFFSIQTFALALFPDNPKAYDTCASSGPSSSTTTCTASTRLSRAVHRGVEAGDGMHRRREGCQWRSTVKPEKPGKWLPLAAYDSVYAWDEVVKGRGARRA